MDETRIVNILDYIGERAKEFILVRDQVLKGEGSLQARDGHDIDEWQACSLLSAFINYIGERERVRYGHFVCDLEAKNSEIHRRDAEGTVARMALFWASEKSDGLPIDDVDAREDLIKRFLENDAKIKAHLKLVPDFYADGIKQQQNREWSIKLKLLGAREVALLKEWKELLAERVDRKPAPAAPPASP